MWPTCEKVSRRGKGSTPVGVEFLSRVSPKRKGPAHTSKRMAMQRFRGDVIDGCISRAFFLPSPLFEKISLGIRPEGVCVVSRVKGTTAVYTLNPLRTAVSFWGQLGKR